MDFRQLGLSEDSNETEKAEENKCNHLSNAEELGGSEGQIALFDVDDYGEKGTEEVKEFNYDSLGQEVKAALNERDARHLFEEGFKSDEDLLFLVKEGCQSLNNKQVAEKGFPSKQKDEKSGEWVEIEGIFMPPSQLRSSVIFFKPKKGGELKPIKYLFRAKDENNPEGLKAWVLKNSEPQIATEGFKDAAIATLRTGVSCMGLSSVNHTYQLEEYNNEHLKVIFDSDAVGNSNVLWQLIKVGVLRKLAIGYLPTFEGVDKVGMCEFFKHSSDGEKAFARVVGNCRKFNSFSYGFVEDILKPLFKDEEGDKKLRESLLIQLVKGHILWDENNEGQTFKKFKKHIIAELGLDEQKCWYLINQALKSLEITEDNKIEKYIGSKLAFCLLAHNKIFPDHDHWIVVNGDFYKWEKNHYCLKPKDIVYRHISNYLSVWQVPDKEGKGTYPYAKPSKVKEVFDWSAMRLTEEWTKEELAAKINKGINFTNCVVTPVITSKGVNYSVEKHDPTKHYFFAEPQIEYNPDCDITPALEYLKCLDVAERGIFLSTLASAFDLEAIWAKHSRTPRALFLLGSGSNGKDVAREIVRLIFGGDAVTAIGTQHFENFDNGSNRFCLAPLATSRINWSSENKIKKLENSASLKQAITGDSIQTERKHKDAVAINPRTIFLFNLNSQARLDGQQEAMKSRYAIIKFPYKYVVNPNPNNPYERKVNSKFKNDTEYIKKKLAPAFFNMLMPCFVEVYRKGIDYSPLDANFKEAQANSSLLNAFIQEVGLEHSFNKPNLITQPELWDKYIEFCIDEGALEEGKWLIDKKYNVTCKKDLTKRLKEQFEYVVLRKDGKPYFYNYLTWKYHEKGDNPPDKPPEVPPPSGDPQPPSNTINEEKEASKPVTRLLKGSFPLDVSEFQMTIDQATEVVLDTETYCPLTKITKKGTKKKPAEYGVLDKKAGLDFSLNMIRLIQLKICYITYVYEFNVNAYSFADYNFMTIVSKACKDEKIKIIGHNLNFDIGTLAFNFPTLEFEKTTNVWDTLIGLYVFYGQYGVAPEKCVLEGGFSLKNACEKLLKLEVDKTEQSSDWGKVELTQEQLNYAAFDCFYTQELYSFLVTKYEISEGITIDKWGFECKLIPIAILLTKTGFPFDREYAQNVINEIDVKINELEVRWNDLTDNKIWQGNGSQSTVDWLKDKYALKTLEKASLANTGEDAIIYKTLKSLTTLRTKVLNMLTSSTQDNRIHTIYKSLSGEGRFKTSSTPCKTNSGKDASLFLTSMQSLPNRVDFLHAPLDLPHIRGAFIAVGGKKLIVIDLPAAHARIAADIAMDETAIASFNDLSIDNHSKVAVFVAKSADKDWEWEYIANAKENKKHPDNKEAKLFRGIAKNTFYAFLNGAGAKKIRDTIKKDTGKEVELSLVEAALNGCRSLYPEIRKFQQNYTRNLPIRNIEGRDFSVNNTRDGFRLVKPLQANSYNGEIVYRPEYTNNLAAIWTRVEATAMKQSLLDCQAVIEQHPEWEGEIVAFMHDEIDFQVKEEFAEDAAIAFNSIIFDNFKAYLSHVSDGRPEDLKEGICDNWLEGK